ncbi:UpxY family transcription antiterminator [Phocaeicola sp.]
MTETNSTETEFADECPWYAVRTFNRQEKKVVEFFEGESLYSFIPMMYSDKVVEKEGRKPEHILVPAIHNLVFLKKTDSRKKIADKLTRCPIPISPLKREADSGFYEIPAREMLEMRMLCDPQFKSFIFELPETGDITVGHEVRILSGPFKDFTGRLIRKSKKYYFVKTIAGMGVMVRISHWNCETL